MEKLTALALLWISGLGNKEDYCALLDDLFLKDPEDDFLLESENRTGDPAATFAQLSIFLDGEFDAYAFGKELFARLEIFCCSGKITANEFAERCFDLWDKLPAQINMKDPFDTLFYAHDMEPGSERQRGFLQYAFDFYKEKK